jgi:hypothetical protein
MFAQLAQEIPRDRWGRPLITRLTAANPSPTPASAPLPKPSTTKPPSPTGNAAKSPLV